jgi:hypothetical protein
MVCKFADLRGIAAPVGRVSVVMSPFRQVVNELIRFVRNLARED